VFTPGTWGKVWRSPVSSLGLGGISTMTAPTRRGTTGTVASAPLSPQDLRPEDATRENTPPEARRSTGEVLLEFAAPWEGDDLEECLAAVASTRSEARF
jgi:hypothetical protein